MARIPRLRPIPGYTKRTYTPQNSWKSTSARKSNPKSYINPYKPRLQSPHLRIPTILTTSLKHLFLFIILLTCLRNSPQSGTSMLNLSNPWSVPAPPTPEPFTTPDTDSLQHPDNSNTRRTPIPTPQRLTTTHMEADTQAGFWITHHARGEPLSPDSRPGPSTKVELQSTNGVRFISVSPFLPLGPSHENGSGDRNSLPPTPIIPVTHPITT